MVETERPELPSAEDVRFYREHGWIVTGQIVPHELLDALGSVIEAHQRRGAGDRLPASVGHADWAPGEDDRVRNSEFLSVQCAAMRRLSLLPAIGAYAASLAGTDRIRLFDDQAVVKEPAADSVVGWHTDHSYWSTCTSSEMLTAWIPFHDSDQECGALMVVDGSHRWPESEHLRGFNDGDLDHLEESLDRRVGPDSVVSLRVAKGQVSFHHMRTIHASAPNRATTARVAVAVHLQDGANRHRTFTDASGSPVVLPHDRLCRRGPDGSPDYSDPAVFPIIWQRGTDG